jgi:predicted DNA-binding protein
MPRQSIHGVRVHVILPKVQKQALAALSKKTGLTESELLRRAVETFLVATVKKAT